MTIVTVNIKKNCLSKNKQYR